LGSYTILEHFSPYFAVFIVVTVIILIWRKKTAAAADQPNSESSIEVYNISWRQLGAKIQNSDEDEF